MSKSFSSDDNQKLSGDTDTDTDTGTGTLSNELTMICELKKEKKQDEFIINNLKCHNRFLRDMIKKIQISARNVLVTDDRMFEAMNYSLSEGDYLSHDGSNIYYPGENNKRKSTL